jgi:hypothetical protein
MLSIIKQTILSTVLALSKVAGCRARASGERLTACLPVSFDGMAKPVRAPFAG